jgi:hypothetical protein
LHGPWRKYGFQQYPYCCMRVVAAGKCSPSCCLETSLVYLLILRPLNSNDSIRYNIIIMKQIKKLNICKIISLFKIPLKVCVLYTDCLYVLEDRFALLEECVENWYRHLKLLLPKAGSSVHLSVAFKIGAISSYDIHVASPILFMASLNKPTKAGSRIKRVIMNHPYTCSDWVLFWRIITSSAVVTCQW